MKELVITTTELARLVREMREAQRKYFRDRTQGDLNRSKELERAVDKAINEVLSGHPHMLPGLG